METRITRKKSEIYKFLSGTPGLQLYTIGDLDDFFWKDTVWYAIYDKKKMQSVALLYTGMDPSTFLLFYEKDPFFSEELLKSIRKLLPARFNVHLSPGLIDIFGKENILEDYGQNFRMILARNPEQISDDNIRKIELDDIPEINDLYKIAYPHNWFDRRMIETGKYFGYFTGGMLVGIAGIHVYSQEYRVAALGNIATHPDFRGRKIAFNLTSFLCNDLRNSVDIIGLNVKSDNMAAIKCYKNIGFEIISSYDECFIQNKE
jgi:ribosomal protein S18 acetylase RimI-like enzyme